MTAEIETARLRLRPLTLEDADALYRLWTDAEVRRYLFDGEIIARARVDEELAANSRLMATEGYGMWAVCERAGSELIGFCGYRYFHDPPQLQLLYGIAPAHWGLGLATEAARAMIRQGFEVHGFDRIVASADAPNVASHRVMEKAGMRFTERVTVDGLDTVYYAIDRDADRVP